MSTDHDLASYSMIRKHIPGGNAPPKKTAMTIFRDKHQMSCLMSKIFLLTTIRFYLTPHMQLKGYDDNVSGMPASSKDIKIFPKLKCLRIDWIIFLEDIRDQLSEFLEIR